MKSASMMALGASLLTFGILWLFFSSSLNYLLFPPTGRNVTLLNQVDFVRLMLGVVIATIGAGLLTYARAARTDGTRQTASS